jgi:hypothetical protein
MAAAAMSARRLRCEDISDIMKLPRPLLQLRTVRKNAYQTKSGFASNYQLQILRRMEQPARRAGFDRGPMSDSN